MCYTPHPELGPRRTFNKPLCIKLNNCETNDPCAICGEPTDSQVGPAIFVEGSWDLVCDVCSQRYAPVLYAVVTIAREVINEPEEPACGWKEWARAAARRLNSTASPRCDCVSVHVSPCECVDIVCREPNK